MIITKTINIIDALEDAVSCALLDTLEKCGFTHYDVEYEVADPDCPEKKVVGNPAGDIYEKMLCKPSLLGLINLPTARRIIHRLTSAIDYADISGELEQALIERQYCHEDAKYDEWRESQ